MLGSLAGVKFESFERLLANYSSRRVRLFLEGLRKDLHKSGDPTLFKVILKKIRLLPLFAKP
jgi:hypothetical protein